jgi:putative ATP-binding cassette transporter
MEKLKIRTLARFVGIVRPFLRSEMRVRAIGSFALLIGLLLTVSALNVVNSYVGRDFMTAVSERKTDRYVQLALAYLIVFAASTVVAVLERFTEERFGLMWRLWLTRRLISKYLSGQVYRQLNASEEVDNPDQRITEDVRNFTVTTLSFTLMILNSTITVCAFLGVLWSITPWLFLVAVAYPTVGTFVAIALGHRLVGLNNRQLKNEADLRFELAHVREYADSLALSKGEWEEWQRLRERLDGVGENQSRIIYLNRRLGFFSNFYNYLIQIIPLVITAPLYFRGSVEFGVVTQSAMAFSQVVNAFSLIVMQFQSISSFAAVVTRLGTLCEAIEGTSRASEPAGLPEAVLPQISAR